MKHVPKTRSTMTTPLRRQQLREDYQNALKNAQKVALEW